MALPATREYQKSMVGLRALTYKDTIRFWPLLDFEDLDRTWPQFAAAMLQLIRARRATAVALARDYMIVMRAGVEEPPPDVQEPELDVVDVLFMLRMASVVSIKKAMVRRIEPDLANRNALVRSMGVADKFIGDGGRDFIRAWVDADPAARGWVRVTLGTCDFCRRQAAGDHMQSGTANFPRHPHCGCQPEPVFGIGKHGLKNPTHEMAFKGANPKYDSQTRDLQATVNCMKVVNAYELRRRGHDVAAKTGAAGITSQHIRDLWGSVRSINSPSRSTLEILMKKHPVGSRFFVSVAWKPPNRGAHIFMAERTADGFRYFDPQIRRSDASGYFDKAKSNISAFRVDNVEPDDKIWDFVE